MNIHLGAHIPGKTELAPIIAKEANMDTIMIMPTSPIRWSLKPIDSNKIQSFVKNLKQIKHNLKYILLHAIYLINLARKNRQLFHLSKMSLITYLDFADRLQKALTEQNLDTKVLGVCVHPGASIDLPEEQGLARVTYGINWILEKFNGQTQILLECTAGSGNIIGDKFEELAQIRNGVKDKSRVGYVIDTQHSFASGYNWSASVNTVVNKIDDILGLNNVKAFHLNDSATDFNSHKDRHANIGEGKIGLETIKKIVYHPKLKNMPFILETPDLKKEGVVNTIERTRKLIINY